MQKDELKQKKIDIVFRIASSEIHVEFSEIIILVDNNIVIKQFWHVLQCF